MNAEVIQPPQLSNGRLLLLGVSAVVLCASFVMTVFAPFPLALAIILYGRAKGLLVGLAGLVASYVMVSTFYGNQALVGLYFCVLVIGVGIAEIALRGVSPVKGMVTFGSGLILTVVATFGLVLNSLNLNPKDFVLKQIKESSEVIALQKKALEESGNKNSIDVLQLLSNDEALADVVLKQLPGYLFMGTFLVLWFNLFLVLKSRRLLYSGNDYPYSEKDLLNFKVPFGFVLLLVFGLVLAVWGSSLGSENYETIGVTIIELLGIFYFFQGFGVFSDLLNFSGITGFFRTLIVMITVFMANYLIAIAGLFDNWFDFRKYFVKRKNED